MIQGVLLIATSMRPLLARFETCQYSGYLPCRTFETCRCPECGANASKPSMKRVALKLASAYSCKCGDHQHGRWRGECGLFLDSDRKPGNAIRLLTERRIGLEVWHFVRAWGATLVRRSTFDMNDTFELDAFKSSMELWARSRNYCTPSGARRFYQPHPRTSLRDKRFVL
jgi:hypothetical protein